MIEEQKNLHPIENFKNNIQGILKKCLDKTLLGESKNSNERISNAEAIYSNQFAYFLELLKNVKNVEDAKEFVEKLGNEAARIINDNEKKHTHEVVIFCEFAKEINSSVNFSRIHAELDSLKRSTQPSFAQSPHAFYSKPAVTASETKQTKIITNKDVAWLVGSVEAMSTRYDKEHRFKPGKLKDLVKACKKKWEENKNNPASAFDEIVNYLVSEYDNRRTDKNLSDYSFIKMLNDSSGHHASRLIAVLLSIIKTDYEPLNIFETMKDIKNKNNYTFETSPRAIEKAEEQESKKAHSVGPHKS